MRKLGVLATEKEKVIIAKRDLTGKEAQYHYKAKFKVREKVKAALNDLEWLSKNCPEAIDQEQIIRVIKAFASQPEFYITKE